MDLKRRGYDIAAVALALFLVVLIGWKASATLLTAYIISSFMCRVIGENHNEVEVKRNRLGDDQQVPK